MFNADAKLMEKWGPVLDHEAAPEIQDRYKKAVTARLLENQEIALQEERAQAQGNFISEAAAPNNIGFYFLYAATFKTISVIAQNPIYNRFSLWEYQKRHYGFELSTCIRIQKKSTPTKGPE